MESFWKGTFANPVHKTVDSMDFVPLEEMSNDDWDWLDFKNLRPTAKNRIVDAIVSGELIGFFGVRVTNKEAKELYFWPATSTSPAAIYFVNEGDPGDIENVQVLDFEDFVDRVNRL